MTPGPITPQCFPPAFREEFHVLTIDPITGKEIETIYKGSNELKANLAWEFTIKNLEGARDLEGASYEPATVLYFGNGETQEIKVA